MWYHFILKINLGEILINQMKLNEKLRLIYI